MKSPWPTKKLGELIEERKEKNKNNEQLQVYAISNIFGFVPSEEFFYKKVYSASLKNYKKVYKDDFAYNPARVNVGSIGLYENKKKGLVSPMYIVFRIKDKNQLLPRFLFRILKSSYFIKKIRSLAASQGSIRQILKFEDLRELQISLPPLPIQKKIVSILDTIQSAINIQNKIIETTKELKKSIMTELFKYGLPAPRQTDLPAPRETFYVYIIRCENDSFYIGYTSDIHKRWLEHQQGKVNWTKLHKPIEIIHYEEYKTREDAVKREKELKTGFGRKWVKREFKAGRLRKWDERAARQAGGPSFRKARLHNMRGQGRKLKKTEIGEIPEDWEVVRLGEIAYIKGGKRLPKGHVFSKEKTDYSYIRVIDFKNGGIDSANLQYLKKEDYELLKNYSISKNDIYISIAGTVGLVGIIPEELDGAVLTENAAKLVIKNSTKFNKLFLVKFLTSDKGQNQIKSLTSKSTQPKLGLYRIAQIKIPLPPLPEQREIAEILQTIDQKIEIEQKKKELYEELFKTMLNKIFTGEIDIEKIEI